MPQASGQVSAACAALCKKFEGCRLVAYMPTPKDRPTIGWGSTFDDHGAPVHMGQRITQAQADAWLQDTLDATAVSVWRLIGDRPTTVAQLDALVVFAYNVGIPALASSTLLKLHRAGEFAGADAQFARWNRQGKTILAGLTRRRAAEAELYAEQDQPVSKTIGSDSTSAQKAPVEQSH